MYRYFPRNGSEQSARYARSQNLSSKAPKPMISRYDGTCKLALCPDRKIVGGVTVIALVNGSWNHETCPTAPAAVSGAFAGRVQERAIEAALDAAQEVANMDDQIADRADDLLAEYDESLAATPVLTVEQIADAADALLNEFDATTRARNLETIRKAIYRVSLHGQEGRYGVDHVNIQLVPSDKYNTVKIADYDGASIGVIRKDGSIRLWDDTDATSSRTLATLAGLEILLGSPDPVKYAEAFAVEAVACMRCARPLVDEKSRARLLGPECASKW